MRRNGTWTIPFQKCLRLLIFASFFSIVLVLYAGELSLIPKVNADSADVSVEVRFFECNDGIDNDGDGDVDYPADSDCDSETDDDESTPVRECNDGIDNDNDTKTDYPDDLGCDSSLDDSEGSDGDGGGGENTRPPAEIDFYGIAHPGASVVLLHNGTIVDEVEADTNAIFHTTASLKSSHAETFTHYAIDPRGTRTAHTPLTLDIANSASITIRDVFLAPTLLLEAVGVDQDSFVFSGYTAPEADVLFDFTPGIAAASEEVKADSEGFYSILVPTGLFTKGDPYSVASQSFLDPLSSTVSRAVQFFFDEELTLLPLPGEVGVGDFSKADLNDDGRVDLVDFSILIYWFDKESFPEEVDLNGDGVVDMVDFSILAYYWTG